MAQVSFNDSTILEKESNNNYVSFLKLKGNGDEAIVRIMCDSTDDFDIVTTHAISVDGKFRTVNCIRDPREPLDKCPLCATGRKVDRQLYIHLIVYTIGDNGTVIAEPKVWVRSLNYAKTLKTLLDEYGPLSNSVFKIHRNGEAGDMSTTYSLMYLNPTMYPEDIYTRNVDAIKNYRALGNAVLDKTFDELAYFSQTGRFPEVETVANSTDSVPPGNATVVNNMPPQMDVSQVNTGYTNYNQYTPPAPATPIPTVAYSSIPVSGYGPQTTIARPVRTY